MTGKTKRVLLYTAGLFVAPWPLMPWAPGTVAFALALLGSGLFLVALSVWMALPQWRVPAQGLVALKLRFVPILTALVGAGMALGAAFWLVRRF